MMIRADLHMHTTISDGSDSIQTIVQKCKQNGLTHIAITNHDDLDGYEEIQYYTENLGIQTVKSLEITTVDSETGTKAHLLGYRIQDEMPIRRLTDAMLQRRHNNVLEQIKRLQNEGYDINVEELKQRVYKIIYKQNLIQYLVEKGIADGIYGSFYQNYFSKGKLCDIRPTDIELKDAIVAIKQAGGFAVLAHPAQQNNYHLLPMLCELGLDGIEYRHPSNDENAKQKILELSKQYNLFLTGGSDYHGTNNKKPVNVGDYLSTEEAVRKIFSIE